MLRGWTKLIIKLLLWNVEYRVGPLTDWMIQAVSEDNSVRKCDNHDSPGHPVVKTPGSQCRGHRLIPDWGTKIPAAA